MDFFYKEKVKQIDFSKGVTFMDKELDKLYQLAKQKNRRGDMLVKIYLKNGKTRWLLIHIEAQGYVDEFFAKRMFQMNYRIFENFNLPVIGFAILTDDDPDFHPKFYEYGCWGSIMRYEFKTYKVLEKNPKDYKDSKNPFAAVMKTAWYGLQKNQLKSDEDRLTLKKKLIILIHKYFMYY